MHNTKSFTLIELIIVIGIIAILSGMSLAYFNNQNDIYKLKADAQKIVDVFDLTRKRAMASEKSAGCTLSNYTITFTVNSYTVTQNQTGASCTNISQNYSINTSFTITIVPPVPPAAPITIKPFYGTLSADTTITINNSNHKCIDIGVTSSGATVGTPIAC